MQLPAYLHSTVNVTEDTKQEIDDRNHVRSGSPLCAIESLDIALQRLRKVLHQHTRSRPLRPIVHPQDVSNDIFNDLLGVFGKVFVL